MGGSQSRTRKITVDNDDPTSVIKVSEDVVQRIKNSQDSAKAAPPAPPVVQPVASQPAPQQFYEPIITSIQQRHTNLTELKKNDDYWQKRMKNLKEHHAQINSVMEEEYKKAMIDLEAVEKKAEKRKPPCETCKACVLECYRLNGKQPMKCALEVQAFQHCVDKSRIDLISTRG